MMITDNYEAIITFLLREIRLLKQSSEHWHGQCIEAELKLHNLEQKKRKSK